jgi:hypothetical protein
MGKVNLTTSRLTQAVIGQDDTTQGVVLSGLTGLAGGLIAGPVAQVTG